MSPSTADLIQLVAYCALIVGVVGTVAPVVPGPLLIWLAALLWAWADGFVHVGWPTLLVLGVLAVIAEAADMLLSVWGARRGGAAWTSVIVSGVAAVVGFVAFNLPGAVAGAFGGLLAAESVRQQGDWRAAWRSSRGMLTGYVVSILAQLVLVAIMVLLFTVQAFGPP